MHTIYLVAHSIMYVSNVLMKKKEKKTYGYESSCFSYFFCLRKKEVKTRLATNVIDFNESNALIYFK